MMEIVVTIALLGVVMTVFMAMVASLQTAESRQQARSSRNDEVKLALAHLDREIRSGNVLIDPALESDATGDIVPSMALRVYTQADAPNRNPGSQCSQWRITNGTLQNRRWASLDDGSVVAGSVTSWWTVATSIVNRTVSPEVPAFTRIGTALVKLRFVVDRADDAGQPEEVDLSITARNTQFYDQSVSSSTWCSVVPTY
jgi:type II secretory pathway component PulJ